MVSIGHKRDLTPAYGAIQIGLVPVHKNLLCTKIHHAPPFVSKWPHLSARVRTEAMQNMHFSGLLLPKL